VASDGERKRGFSGGALHVIWAALGPNIQTLGMEARGGEGGKKEVTARTQRDDSFSERRRDWVTALDHEKERIYQGKDSWKRREKESIKNQREFEQRGKNRG